MTSKMAVRYKFIHFNTRSGFNSTVPNPGLNSAQGNEYYNYVVFIKETKEIYTHGEFYDCSEFDDSEIREMIQDLEDKYDIIISDYPQKDSFKTVNGESILIEDGDTNIETPDTKVTSASNHYGYNSNNATSTTGAFVTKITKDEANHVTSFESRSLTATDIPGIDASKITSGTISIERLPAGALERMFVVESETAAMSATVQEGDVVQVTGNNNKMYFCISDTATTFATKFKEFTAGTATSVSWSGITGKPDLATQEELNVVDSKFANYFLVSDFTKANIKSTLDISDWALASAKPTIKNERLTNLDSGNPWTAFYTSFQPSNRPAGANYFTGFTLTNADFQGQDSTYKVQLAMSHTGTLHTRYMSGGSFQQWKTIAFTSDIPTSLKNPNALSWSGYSSGSYDGSTAQNIVLPTKLSQLTDDVVSGKYLPLSGGTVKGNFRIDRNPSCIQFIKSGISVGFLGIDSDLTPIVYNGAGNTAYIILHSGNYSTLLAGGTINGSLSLTSGSDAKLRLNNTDADTKYQYISFQQDGVEYGKLGTFGNDNLMWGNSSLISVILHAGNYTKYALSVDGGTVNGSITATSFIGNLTGDTANIGTLQIITNEINGANGTGNAHINYSSTGKVTIANGGGNVAIGGTTADEKLHIHGNVKASGNMYATDFCTTSDNRLKDFTKDVIVDFNELKNIPKKYYYWKDKSMGEELQIGTSAQELAKIYPECVHYDETNDRYSVNYQKLSIVALAAIDKLHDRISELESKLYD